MRLQVSGIILLICWSMQSLWAQEPIDPDTLWNNIAAVRNSGLPIDKQASLIEEYQKQARALKNDSLIAYCEHRLALSYYDLDLYENAIPHYIRAFQLRQTANPINLERTTRSGFYAGLSSMEIGDLDQTESILREVIAFPPHRYVILAYKALGLVSSRNGDFVQADAYFEQAFRGSNRLNPTDKLELQLDFMNIIFNRGDTIRYRPVIDKSEQFLQELIVMIENDEIDKDNLPGYYQNLALLCDKVHEDEKRIAYNNLAIEHSKDSLDRADILNNLGNIFRRTNRIDQAEKHIGEARAIYEDLGNQNGLSMTADNLGEVFLSKKEFARSRSYFDSALMHTIGRPFTRFSNDFVTLNPYHKLDLALYLGDQARCYYTWFEHSQNAALLDSALLYYGYADKAIDMIRRSLAQDDAHLHWRARAREIYAPAYTAAIRAKDHELALHFMDKGKALVLTEAIQKDKSASLIPDSLRRLEERLGTKISSFQDRIHEEEHKNEPDTSRLLILHDSLLKTQERYKDLHEAMLRDYPAYFPEFSFDLATVQNQLSQDQSILSYFLTADTVISALINNREVRFKYLGSRHYLDSLLGVNQALMAEAEQHAAVGNTMTEFHYTTHLKNLGNTCKSLYDFLLRKWGELPERLMIIPDDRLFTLNFDMLLTDRPEPDAPLYKWPFAIRNHVFSYNHSIANWLELTGKTQVKRKVVGIAPAIQEPYAPLKYSQAGLEQIQGFNLKLLSGPEANRSQIEALGRNTILDFQTHAVVSERQNSYSFILLNTEEGFLDSLYLKDIYHFKLPGTFVVLTACETHVGNIARGEGVISLARAFTYAGASGMITSLWKVDDYTSSLLMEHFYGYLGQGDEKDVALRKAKLDLLDNAQDERSEHPFYWASMIHIGNTAALASNSRLWVIAGICIVGLILFVAGIRLLIKRQSAPGTVESL